MGRGVKAGLERVLEGTGWVLVGGKGCVKMRLYCEGLKDCICDEKDLNTPYNS